jgi:DNA-binding LacI/PurR family transcriptional regulator/DNA-binding transcriptional regulator YhcF (GntR family)
MSTTLLPQVPLIVQLADRIEDDIRLKSLKPGDAYLGAADAARMLRVSTRTANRALQLLAQRRVLERRQRKGTFISESVRDTCRIGRLHLLVHQDYLRTEGLLADGVVIGMQGELPSAEIQFNFMPLNDEAGYVNRLIAEATRSATPEGFVLVRTSLAVQRLVEASGLPAVVNGILFPSVSGLTSIDRDHYQVGQLLCQRLLDQGLRRVVVLMNERVLPGHHQTLDAIRDTLDQAGLGAGAMTQRCLPADQVAITHEVRQLISSAQEPLGLICRSKPLADGATQAVASLRLPVRRLPTIVVCDLYGSSAQQSPYLYCRQILSPEQIGARIGRSLAQQAAGSRPSPGHEIIPVVLIQPEGSQ